MIDCSVILPVYNSATHLEARVRECEQVLRATHWSWEILLCDDGSRDNSPTLCQRLAEESPQRRCFISPHNRGRGRNVSDGIRQSRGRWVGFMDVDNSTASLYLVPIIFALNQGFQIAEANRSYKIRLLELPHIFHRLAAHVVYSRMVRWCLGIRGHDTESGFKFFQRDTALRLIERVTSDGWFWDTEIIARAHELGYQVAEIESLFIRTPKMGTTVRLLQDSWIQARSLAAFAWTLRKSSLHQACCINKP